MAKRPEGKEIKLPSPIKKGEMSLEEAISKRRSKRQFKDKPLTENEISQILWAAHGVTDSRGYRTTPSAGRCTFLSCLDATSVRRRPPRLAAPLVW